MEKRSNFNDISVIFNGYMRGFSRLGTDRIFVTTFKHTFGLILHVKTRLLVCLYHVNKERRQHFCRRRMDPS